ncbi:hypothetical protein BU26DRAFT_515722 [Trematosphaeria pertusa]|uniref:Uncharacterized protein n=1 Tax=Trematosphaeria pertusa TaxID=390896 RepID=A0A6A6IS43_9PLEO|nr:uncharacterized protein BU26DRAFT_515722 [Trematosphaeria pertusa]KAF2253354.1 hypothetical protein BU26DRAFT_515722 [Trematosphaeria pertusa]
MSSARGQRIEANCKIIWGADCEYDLDNETDDYVHYMAHVKKDFGVSFGPPLAMTGLCGSSEAALAELDRMLELWAKQVKRGTPMTKDERLEIFGGPKGKHKKILSKFIDEFEKRERAKRA